MGSLDSKRQEEEDAHRRARIDALIDKARAAAGGEMISGLDPDCPLEVAEQFWSNVVAYETAPTAPLFDRLAAAGVPLPDPDTLVDNDVHAALWRVIEGMASLKTFLDATDHLSDRELYRRLWHEVLRVPEQVMPPDSGWNSTVDMSGAYDDGERYIEYLRYYADEEARDFWLEDNPDEELPEHEEPPFDRDRLLPSPGY